MPEEMVMVHPEAIINKEEEVITILIQAANNTSVPPITCIIR